ncbi:Ig-like domain-containing protein [Methylomagnum sp.]
MKQQTSRVLVGALLGISPGFGLHAGALDAETATRLQSTAPDQEVPVIVTLTTKANLNAIRDRAKGVRRGKVIQALKQHADKNQKPVLDFLRSHSASRVKSLWIINGIAARVPTRAVRGLAKLPGVARVQVDSTLSAPGPNGAALAAPEWNINLVHAPEVWELGHTGQQVLVANMDTGVDKDHPDLGPKWRGGANSWFDPHGQHATPVDYAGAASGHGTQTMGLLVGGEAGGTAIGVAPGAQWIAVKVFNDLGQAQESDFHLGFQWLLDPDGNSLTDDAPDVVNGSFQIAAAGLCDTRFEADIQTLKTAAIAVAFAAGNGGPLSATSVSPANNAGGFGVGAVDDASNLAYFSSRGPSACGGGLFPQLVAPGVNVNTTDLSFGGLPLYMTVSGTSFAAAHVAGGLALLLGAFPNSAVSTLESALVGSATDLGPTGPDHGYGHGLLNVQQAHALLQGGSQNPAAVEDSHVAEEDTTLTVAAPGVLGNDTDPQNDPLTAVLVSDVAHGTLALNGDGSFIYTPAPNYHGADSFTYKARDGGQHDSGVTTVAITVNPANDPPTAANDGPYTATAGVVLSVPAPGLLVNDSDIDQDTLTTQGSGQTPAHGSATVNADGSFSYSPTAGYVGPDSFAYQACDPANACATATVNLNVRAPVNQPPVAVGDVFLYRANVARAVNPPGLLRNDTDPELNPLAARFVAGSLANGGTLTCPPTASPSLCPNGSFTYFRATGNNNVSFRYRADDGAALSEPATGATVSLRVDAAPTAVGDNCVYDRSANSVTQPTRCTVTALRTVRMNLAANDTDPNDPSLANASPKPTDGAGARVVPGTLLVTVAGTGVTVGANPACGQGALGTSATRAVIANHCDGSVTVTMTAGNTQNIGYSYRVSDDLGAPSAALGVTLSSVP